MPSSVDLRLLGPVDIRVAGHPLTVDTRKAVAAVAYLAVTGRPASRDTLAALLWPDAGDVEAKGALRRTLSVLRAALGGVGLTIDRSTVALREDEVDVDVRRFRDFLAAARDHGHGPDEPCRQCIEMLEAGAALDRGEFMAGFALRDSDAFDEWQRAEAEAHRRDLAGLLERLARAHAADGNWSAAAATARRWLELDPLHEPAHRLLMLIHAHAGEPGAAIQQYRQCVRVLEAELGVAPLNETTELYEAIRTDHLPSAPASRVASEPPIAPPTNVRPLVGRQRELDALTEAYKSVEPDGRLVVIEGEPGIGKTALLTSFASRIEASGGVVIATRAFPGEDAIAYGPIVEMLRAGLATTDAAQLPGLASSLQEIARLLPIPGHPAPLAGPDADPFGRTRLMDALAGVLPALVMGQVPGLIVVDDLHLADTATLDAIAWLARRLARRPFCFVVSWRAEELPDETRGRLVGAAGKDAIPAVTLRRLTRNEVAEWVSLATRDGIAAGSIDALFEESEGLPLYVAEALADMTLSGAMPGGVRSLLRARIASVGELGSQVLAAASVLGRSFDLRAVRNASGRSEEETVDGLEELIRRGLVRETASDRGDPRYDFTHGRLREVAYEDLSLARRRLLHGRVADALTSGDDAGGPHDAGRWARIAQHATAAGRTADAAEAHLRAGEGQMAAYANREAAEHFEAALALGHPAARLLHERLGELLTLRGDYARAVGHFEAAAANLDRSEPEASAAIEHRLALVHARRGDWSRAASHAQAAVAGTSEPLRRSTILADRSAIALQAGDADAAERFAREAVTLASSASEPGPAAAAEHISGVVASHRGDLAAAAAHLGRAVELASRSADVGLRVAALNSAALVAADAGDRERAIDLTTEALELCTRQGDRHRQAALENNLADFYHALGQEAASMDHLKRAVALFSEIDSGPGGLEPEIWKLVEW